MILRSTRYFLFILAFALSSNSISADLIEQWGRHEITLVNPSYSGNPFELEVDATFTHSATGREIKLPGYYAGNNRWKIGFMPILEGQWKYTTSSADPELDDVSGNLDCIDSDNAGMIKADKKNTRKWKYTDAGYVLPIQLRVEFFSEPGSLEDFRKTADFMQANNLHILETRLLEEYGLFDRRHDFIFKGDWRKHEFDLDIWDRMQKRMDVLADNGLGAHIMFYSDDAGKPGWLGKSDTEKLVLRYVIARLAAYPTILYNTGIDIDEFRDQAWVDWFGKQVQSLDPYDHPISSRYGGGSGKLVMTNQSFDSRGDRLAIIDDMTEHFIMSDVPVSMDDAWGENRKSRQKKNFRPDDIRRAFWKAVVAGGLGGLIRGQDGFFHIGNMDDELKSEQWLKHINPFINENLGEAFGEMVPTPSLVSNGYCLSDPARTKILYFLMGKNDRWDHGDGGDITVKLVDESGDFTATWFDTRTGANLSAGQLSAGKNHILKPPTEDDWVLLLDRLQKNKISTQENI